MGILDWVTTVLGVHYFGAVELNPLFACIVSSNMLFFSVIKLAGAVLVGFLFYLGYALEEKSGITSNLSRFSLRSGYCASLTLLMFVVANNLVAIVSLL